VTKQDATMFLCGYLVGVSLNERLQERAQYRGALWNKAARKGIEILLRREKGFFNALERIVRDELELSGFNGEVN